MNPYFLGAGILALAAATAGGFVKGEQWNQARVDQAALHQLTNALNDRDAKQKTIDALEARNTALENTRQTIVREITREQTKIINRPIYQRQCIDADGVQLLDRAHDAASRASVDPGAPAGTPAGPAQSPENH